MTRVLLLAGTTEARAIARALTSEPDINLIASLAGATSRPVDLGCEVRTGGFGGVEGLWRYLRDAGIDLLVDATHPFAAQMKANASAQAIPTVHVMRQAWQPAEPDNWIHVSSLAEAAKALPSDARAFLALGVRHLSPFEGHSADMLVRTVEPAGDHGGRFRFVRSGPGTVADELELLRDQGISHLVCRNSGGRAGYAKIEAARRLGLPVIMVARPEPPAGQTVETADAAVAWCLAQVSGLPR